jgi:hypothetical protein
MLRPDRPVALIPALRLNKDTMIMLIIPTLMTQKVGKKNPVHLKVTTAR